MRRRPCVGATSAELSSYESADPSRELFGLCLRLGLGEHTDQRLGAGAADEHAAAIAELDVDPVDLAQELLARLAPARGEVLLHLWVLRHHRRGLGERA